MTCRCTDVFPKMKFIQHKLTFFPKPDSLIRSTVHHLLQYIHSPDTLYHSCHKYTAVPPATDPHSLRLFHKHPRNSAFPSDGIFCFPAFLPPQCLRRAGSALASPCYFFCRFQRSADHLFFSKTAGQHDPHLPEYEVFLSVSFFRDLFRHFHLESMDQFFYGLFCDYIFGQTRLFPAFAIAGLYCFS